MNEKSRTLETGFKALMTTVIALVLSLSFLMPASMVMGASGTSENQEPKGWVGGDFILSFDEQSNENDASNPSVAVTPRLGGPYDGTIHVVWHELNEDDPDPILSEIHYSKSTDNGLTWTGEDQDIVISAVRKQSGQYQYLNAVNASICIDNYGFIHVIWAELIHDTSQGFYFWEFMYSRSEDNGDTWTSVELGDDIRISQMEGSRLDGEYVSAPQIAVSYSQGKAETILHAVWAELDDKGEQEIYYSRSTNGGDFWTGLEQNRVISRPGDEPTFDPTIAVTGPSGEFVHVAWRQRTSFGFDEILYTKSNDLGGTWPQEEYYISYEADDGMMAGAPSMVGEGAEVFAVWSQGLIGKAPDTEIFYSASFNDGQSWMGTAEDFMISDPDGYPAYKPSIGYSKEKFELHVAWSEIDESSPRGSREVHNSWSDQPDDPYSFTGIDKDYVLSWPDEEEKADVNNVSLTMGNIEGEWREVIVWDEPNVGMNKATPNIEIHTIPDTHTLTLNTVGSGGINANPAKPTYNDGEIITLTANPSAGWSFDHWSGDLSGSTNPDMLVMDGDKTVTAHFTQDQYTLTVSITPGGTGSVVKNPNLPTYTYGTSVQLTANPIAGYRFDHWSGALSGSTNPETIIMNGNRFVTAHFAQITFDIPISGGWNLISTPLVPFDTSVPAVFNDMLGDTNITQIQFYDPLDTTDHWKTYASYKPSALNDLSNVDEEMGVWVFVPPAQLGDGLIKVTGAYPGTTSINLRTGWNLVSYPAMDDSTYDVDDLITDTGATGVEGQSGGTYNISPLTGTYVLQNGQAYWVHVSSDTTWFVNW